MLYYDLTANQSSYKQILLLIPAIICNVSNLLSVRTVETFIYSVDSPRHYKNKNYNDTFILNFRTF